MMKRSHEDLPGEGSLGCGEEEHGGRERWPAFSDGSFERASGMLRALGDERRLRLVELLSQGESCVTQIAAQSGEGMSTISQRLRLLRSEGLVVGRREGKHIYYSLADAHVSDLIQSVLSHAEEEVGTSRESRERKEMSEATADSLHTGHNHEHSPGCEHTGVRHDGHTDYLHDGHLHHQREDGAVEEHALPVGGENPEDCTPEHAAEHDYEHVHGPNCGHESVPHGDHTDYLVGNHLHHPHGDHCDDHGSVEVAS